MAQVGFDRRTFLRRGAMGAGALWALSLRAVHGAAGRGASLVPSPYGPIAPAIDETTGLPLMQLPEGFRYSVVQLDRRHDVRRRRVPRACTTGWRSSTS